MILCYIIYKYWISDLHEWEYTCRCNGRRFKITFYPPVVLIFGTNKTIIVPDCQRIHK